MGGQCTGADPTCNAPAGVPAAPSVMPSWREMTAAKSRATSTLERESFLAAAAAAAAATAAASGSTRMPFVCASASAAAASSAALAEPCPVAAASADARATAERRASVTSSAGTYRGVAAAAAVASAVRASAAALAAAAFSSAAAARASSSCDGGEEERAGVWMPDAPSLLDLALPPHLEHLVDRLHARLELEHAPLLRCHLQ